MRQEHIESKGGPFVLKNAHTAVLLDRQPLWLEAVESVLERTGARVVGKTTTPTAALESIAQHNPDLFVTGMETEPGEIDGVTCIRQACARCPGLRVIVLSSHREHVEKALQAGAGAYVFKSAHPDDLASAIRQLFGHSVYFASAEPSPSVPAPAPPAPPAALDLTGREREILQLVAEGYSNARLAKMLWVTEQTVKFHLSNVYRKLDVSNRTEASRWAQLNGLLPTKTGATDELRLVG
jgi:DNA-binding NarL/FixJ family response regulator